MYALVLQKKLCLHLANRFNSLKHIQHFDAHNSNEKKKKEEERKNIQLTTFQDMLIITKYFDN